MGNKPSENRREQTKEWAARRQRHLENPNPGLIDWAGRKLGNVYSNFWLNNAERNDREWDLYKKDNEGFLESPVDSARFNVYQKMLEASKAGTEPSRDLKKQWEIILHQGEIPFKE